jgi:hypothetical protein
MQGGYRALPAPHGVPASLDDVPTSAEAYLQLVRALSQRVPDVMVMDSPQAPPSSLPPITTTTTATATATTTIPSPTDVAWKQASLEAFVHLRTTLLHIAVAYEEGRIATLPQHITERSAPLKAASAAEWRRLCFGHHEGSGGGGEGAVKVDKESPLAPAIDSFAGLQVWKAAGEEEEEEEEEGENCNDDYDDDDYDNDSNAVSANDNDDNDGTNNGNNDDDSGKEEKIQSKYNDDGGECSSSDTSLPSPIPPLLSAIVSLDQLSLIRALSRSIRQVKINFHRGGHTSVLGASATAPIITKTTAATAAVVSIQITYISASEVAWIYALLAGLQLPLLNTTAAVLRDLYLLMLKQRAALAIDTLAEPAARAGVDLLALLTGIFFGQQGS